MELFAPSEIEQSSIDQAKLSKREEIEETESESHTRLKTIFLGPRKMDFSAIFNAKNYLNIITQEIAMKAELNISPYTSKSKENLLKPIGQVKNLEVTFGNEEKIYIDFVVLENFNQILFEEKPSISSSLKESIPHAPDRKSKGKEPEDDKLEVEDSESIKKSKRN
ncbi:hypothetical protein O181_058160 [Austropuccinia psidii MF-1]|uniref:Uncharacterized protein n=1 Tax=Austropuccinia psidii MF-1 TaxID=1389203 RepID=A0A9Q3E953_9BASI|nr:hypothetical protein [Austropuccinia psidii MF-1]